MTKSKRTNVTIIIQGDRYCIRFGDFSTGTTDWYHLDWTNILRFGIHITDKVFIRVIPK